MNLDKASLKPALGFSEVEWAFGEMIARRGGLAEDSGLEVLAAAALHATSESHSCLDLAEWHASLASTAQDHATLPLPTLEEWQKAIQGEWSAAIFEADAKAARDSLPEGAPLIWSPRHQALYLRQYFQAEAEIRAFVEERFAAAPNALGEEEIRNLNPQKLSAPEANDQLQAIRKVFQKRLAIITGGPGTGKTTTLATLLAMELCHAPELRIALCAPTGKAATQMQQAIAAELECFHFPDETIAKKVRFRLSTLPCQTIHRLLGITPHTGNLPKANAENPLPFDLVVVDEGSMVALLLFRKLLAALPANSGRLLLLGDKDQLDSVESGRVFGELCKYAARSEAARASGADLPYARLRTNFRSKENPALVEFAQTLASALPSEERSQELAAALYQKSSGKKLFEAREWTECEAKSRTADETRRKSLTNLLTELLDQWGVMRPQRLNSPEEALQHLNDFKVLCALHDGPCGTRYLNDLLVEILLGSGAKADSFPNGLPLMVTKNDSVTHLSNGDVGVCWNGQVWFPATGQDAPRSFRPAQLPESEVAFAMTVHKAQGGSYNNVVIFLPPAMPRGDLLTVNLVYTAVTRARENCLLLAKPKILATALHTATRRWGHLFDA